TVSYSAERKQYGGFPGGDVADSKKRMHYASYFLIRKKGGTIDWDGTQFHQVNGKIAFQLGYSVGEQLHQLKVPVDETNDSLYNVGRKILTGRVAAAAVMDSDAAVLMHGPLAPQLEMVKIPLVEKPYYLMLSNALVKARPALAEQIWKGIEDVRNGKEYIKLVQAAGVEPAR
ncbi:MAG: amino acid ABC transporter substrate-binding protein, partial [Massilia sp.]